MGIHGHTASGSKLGVSTAHGEQHIVCFKRPGQPDMSRDLDQQEDLSSWQLDLDGIQLVERGQLLAEKLVQSSRRGRFFSIRRVSTFERSFGQGGIGGRGF